MNTDQLLLIDLSGIAHMIWHVSGNEPDPSYIGNEIVNRVRALASEHPHAAICCDSGKSFRADIDPTYKANRDTENRAPLRHQMDVACERLKRDGFVVWKVPGFEADDVIATAVAQALAIENTSVLIASSDKDLLQLVNDRVSAKSIANGNVFGPAEVFDKFGVKPEQMGDLLALMGDKSDNIKGAEKIGQVIGARLLSEHGTLAALYDKMAVGVVSGVTPGMRTNLMEFKARWPTVRQLIALRTDAPIPFEEIAAERTAPPMEEVEMDAPSMTDAVNEAFQEAQRKLVPFERGNDANDAPLPDAWADARKQMDKAGIVATAPTSAVSQYASTQKASAPRADGHTSAGQPSIPNGADSGRASKDTMTTAGAVSRLPQSDVVASVPNAGVSGQLPVPVEFSQQLEPRTMPEAITLAKHMFESRLFSAYGTPQAVLATVLAGRELGIPAMASLRAFHVIEGKPSPSADTLAALVMKSGKCKYFRCTERTTERATFVTQRLPVEDYPEQTLTFTIDDAKKAWKKDQKAWDASGWGKVPAAMLVARAKSSLARLEYPDVVGNLYGFEEME